MSLKSLVRRFGLTAIIVILCLFTVSVAAFYKFTQERVAGVSIEKPVVTYSPAPSYEPSPEPSIVPSVKPKYIAPKTVAKPSPAPSTVPMVSCGLNNNSTYVTMTKSECDQKQAEENERARNSTTNSTYISPFKPFPSLAPNPSMAPYVPSQEYQNAQNNFNNSVNASYAPSQFVPPSPKCNPIGDGFNCF